MRVDEFPDRIIHIDGIEYLYFGGTNYLGITTHPDFQNIVFESIKKWGTAYGSSRNSNIQLSIYETAEKLLAKNMVSEAALTVSSGMLAGKLVVDYLSKTSDAIFHFPDTHPAIMNPSSIPIIENGKLNPKLFENGVSKITILADAIPSLYTEPINLDILSEIPIEKEVTMVIDESHSIGIYGNDWQNKLKKENIKLVKVASLGKALGLSGGVIAGNADFITKIRNQDCFVGASGMHPAFLESYCKAQELYRTQKQKLQHNLNYLATHFVNRDGFSFETAYPVIYFEQESISNKLLENKIITTSFKYTNASGKLNRIVITANHLDADLEQLVVQLNSKFCK